jgi:hypothetical protein
METSSSTNATGVQIPNYPLAAGDLIRSIEHSGSVVATSTEEDGEYYAMAMAHVMAADLVPQDAIIVVPLTQPAPDEVLDFTFVSRAKSMFVQLHERPQPLRTYGHVAAYSAGAPVRPLAVGATFKFPTVASFIVAKRELATAIRATRGSELNPPVPVTAEKRQCIRLLGEEGELADDTGSRFRGTSSYLLDLNGVRHPTRNKSDIAVREKELHFMMRAMEKERREYGITSDLALQAEVYRRMICEQGDTQAEDRIPTFMSCGLISRIHRLQFFQKTEKLKLLLMGCVLLEGSDEPTLNLEDFVTQEKISTRSTPCTSNNVGLVSALKNLQLSMQIVFSEFFETCLDSFIENLEGAFRPMELVAADFLKHSVELVLRRSFRIIRSVKSSSLLGISVQNPEHCAALFSSAFDKLSDDLSEHHSMVRQDAHFRVYLARKTEVTTRSRPEAVVTPKPEKSSVKFVEGVKEEKGSPGPAKICSGHMGKQLAAVRKDGRPYVCAFDKSCTFVHMSIAGKSDERLTEIASSMPAPIKHDLIRAINMRKK